MPGRTRTDSAASRAQGPVISSSRGTQWSAVRHRTAAGSCEGGPDRCWPSPGVAEYLVTAIGVVPDAVWCSHMSVHVGSPQGRLRTGRDLWILAVAPTASGRCRRREATLGGPARHLFGLHPRRSSWPGWRWSLSLPEHIAETSEVSPGIGQQRTTMVTGRREPGAST